MVLFRGRRRMQDSSIQNPRIHAEITVNNVDFRTFASCILNHQCRAGPCDRILFKPIRYKPFPSPRRKFGRERCDWNLTELHPDPLRGRHRDDVIKPLGFEHSTKSRVAAVDLVRRRPMCGNAFSKRAQL